MSIVITRAPISRHLPPIATQDPPSPSPLDPTFTNPRMRASMPTPTSGTPQPISHADAVPATRRTGGHATKTEAVNELWRRRRENQARMDTDQVLELDITLGPFLARGSRLHADPHAPDDALCPCPM